MDTQDTWVAARELFRDLSDHPGPDAFPAVVEPWLRRAEREYVGVLAEDVARLPRSPGEELDERAADLLWELYALSRVSDVLLLAFQPRLDQGSDPLDGWPAVTRAQYRELFTRLGMAPFEQAAAFDPFLHEIVEVEQAADPDEPISVTEVVWPGLWHGHVLFGRAGVRVRAGVRHAERGVADRAPLYWTYVRRHRPTVDLSQGWGHNSQWRTDFRVDVRTPEGAHLNVCEKGGMDTVSDVDELLTSAERRELLIHRSLVRAPDDIAGLSALGEGWQESHFPFGWQLS
ncbi:hypothetical protein BN159_8331 [Streptomyces davaonensis JCM 4913]|uniref:Uncharacterized protein n=1 Tax=Streptomyces davaonensis (strain DSM 101723 / JCM 4913 / KCC S-0913 / 768) TaxID=1214101 RepID=K4RGZ2_STRDJ|nr:hypothetical protein [Streptomyces davaonensis]CCK32709.1 hypothetical protein BN159_8331 [Streptomyces davaonensis JCM 4913]